MYLELELKSKLCLSYGEQQLKLSTFLVFYLLLYTEKFGASLIHEQFRDHQGIWAVFWRFLWHLPFQNFTFIL